MASSLSTKLRIAGSVLFATGFFDAVAGRFLFQPRVKRKALARGGARPHPLPSFSRQGTSPCRENEGSARDSGEGDYLDLAGALHIHSTYSDGGGDIPTVIAGACEAGVDFVLLADHNTQRPLRDGWEQRYEERPLLLIGTEVT